jgi:hypothetical protein
LQSPPQHSSEFRHASPTCRQKDGCPQTPSLQNLEQHWPSFSQGFPAVRQPGFSGAHTSFVQLPLQHCPADVQPSPSAVQRSPEHSPPMQA